MSVPRILSQNEFELTYKDDSNTYFYKETNPNSISLYAKVIRQLLNHNFLDVN